MGSGSQINGAAKLIGRRNYCDESVMAWRHRRPVRIRVTTWQKQTQAALCVLIYPEKLLQPLCLLLPDPLLLCPSPPARRRTVSLQNLDGPQTQTLKWALIWRQTLLQTEEPVPHRVGAPLLVIQVLIQREHSHWTQKLFELACHQKQMLMHRFSWIWNIVIL